jgi:ubiquinone/menaquinone biosynthesis C-methylase UbiE
MHKKNSESFWNNTRQVFDFGNKDPAKFLVDYFSRLSEENEKKVLDIGCGGGRNTIMLMNLGFDVFACDLHKEMVLYTKEKVRNIRGKKVEDIIMASMLSLPYSDESFDYIVSNGVFHNVNSIEELGIAIKEASRVLKNGGKLVLNIFSASIIDKNLHQIDEFVYITPQGLSMVLVTKEYLEGVIKNNKLYCIKEITETEVVLKTGKRSVLRGIFKKNKKK